MEWRQTVLASSWPRALAHSDYEENGRLSSMLARRVGKSYWVLYEPLFFAAVADTGVRVSVRGVR